MEVYREVYLYLCGKECESMWVKVHVNKTRVCESACRKPLLFSPSVARVDTIDAVATNTLHFLIGKIVNSFAGGKSIWITPNSEILAVVLSAGTGTGGGGGREEHGGDVRV